MIPITAWRTLLCAAGLTVCFPLAAQSPQEQDMTQIHITMSGSPGTEFSAHWRITHEGETSEHVEEHGTVPTEYTFTGTELEGTVKLLSDDERLEVDIQKGSNRSRSSTQGAGGTLTVSIR
tara:strand:+ start:638 stop:1000 length:363 start_codon:yes stop_codon:yes gene_type:complete